MKFVLTEQLFLIAKADPLNYPGSAWSPYVVGGLIGLLSMLTFYFSNKPLGASTAHARVAGMPGLSIAPKHTRCNYDAIAVIVGMIAGSYVFAEMSGWIGRRIDPIGNRGKITLHNLLPFNPTAVVMGSVVILCGVLALIEYLAVR